MTTSTKSAFAKRINRVPSYVTELIAHGRMVLTADGKRVEVAASLEKIAATASGANPAVAARHAAARSAPIPRKKRKVAEIQEGSRQFYELKIQQIKNNHKTLDFELAIKKRFLLPRVRHEAHSLGNTLRASIEKLIDLTAPQIAALADGAAREQALNIETKKLGYAIKKELPRAMRRLVRG